MITGPRSVRRERAMAGAVIASAALLGSGCSGQLGSSSAEHVEVAAVDVPDRVVVEPRPAPPRGGSIASGGPGVSLIEAPDEVATGVEATFERYQEALVAHDGSGAVAEVSAGTFVWYEATRDLALSADPDQLTGERVPLLQAVSVIQLRALLGAEIDGMTGQELVAWGVDEGLIGATAGVTALSGVEVGAEAGEAFARSNGLPVLRFVDEGGAWKVDLPYTIDQTIALAGEEAMIQRLSAGEATTRTELFEQLALGYGTTWDAVSQPAAP